MVSFTPVAGSASQLKPFSSHKVSRYGGEAHNNTFANDLQIPKSGITLAGVTKPSGS